MALFGWEFLAISALSLIVLLVLILYFDTNSNVLLLKDTTITYLRKYDANPVIYGYDELMHIDLAKGVKTSGYARFMFKDGAKYKGVLDRASGLDVSYDDFRAFILEVIKR
jgi:hypothetical protein